MHTAQTFLSIVFACLMSCQKPDAAAVIAPPPQDSLAVIPSLVDSTEPGTPLIVYGRLVESKTSASVGDAVIYVYQTDARGVYSPQGPSRPRLFAHLRSSPDGRFVFRTIMPGSYPDTRTPRHIHFEIRKAGYDELITEIMFDDDPFVTGAMRRSPHIIMASVRRTADGPLEVIQEFTIEKQGDSP